ncbi:MAG: nodulation protein NfeD, partial [Thermoprotei archaeon]
RSNVIDLVAENVGDLLMKIDGMEVKVAGEVVKINTKGFTIEKYEWSISDILSNALADPLLANLLFMLGFYILLLSLITGHYPIVAVGLLLLILGLMGLGFSINTISTLLIIVGVVLVVIEMITPGFGIIGTTGIIMLALGFLLLPIYLPQTWFIGPEFFFRFIVAGILIIVAGSAFFAFALYKVIKAKKAKPVIWSIIGAKGKSLDDLGPGKEGFVMVEGEYWMAFSDEEIKAGEEIVVVEKVGPKLKVKKVSRK